MRIVRIQISNFRCVKTATLFPQKHNVLLGPNNVGKTAVLEALNLLLNPEITIASQAIDENDFWKRNYIAPKTLVPPLTPRSATHEPTVVEPASAEPQPAVEDEEDYPPIRIEAVLSELTKEDEDEFPLTLVPWKEDTSEVIESTPEGAEALQDAVILALAAVRDLASGQNAKNIQRAAVALMAMNAMWNRRIKSVRDHFREVLSIAVLAFSDPTTPLGKFLQSLREGLPEPQHLPTFISAVSSYKEFKVTASRLSSHDHLRIETGRATDGQLSLFEHFRASRSAKGLYGEEIPAGTTHVLTYHKAKGREFDCVVMLVDPREESTKPPLDEKRRLYYVCATRAKRWLGVVHFGKEMGSVLAPVVGR